MIRFRRVVFCGCFLQFLACRSGIRCHHLHSAAVYSKPVLKLGFQPHWQKPQPAAIQCRETIQFHLLLQNHVVSDVSGIATERNRSVNDKSNSAQRDTMASHTRHYSALHIKWQAESGNSPVSKIQTHGLIQIASAALHGRRTVLPRVAVEASLAVADREAAANIDDHVVAGRSRCSVDNQISHLTGARNAAAVLKQRSRVSRAPVGAIQNVGTCRAHASKTMNPGSTLSIHLANKQADTQIRIGAKRHNK